MPLDCASLINATAPPTTASVATIRTAKAKSRIEQSILNLTWNTDRPENAPPQGIFGIEGILPGSCDVRPPVALLTAHDARMSVAC